MYAFTDLLASIRHGQRDHYQVIETELGPRISGSRAMVYDVLDYQQRGKTRGEIALLLNLKLPQVEVAFEYIEQHRVTLESELIEIKARQVKEETEARAKQKELHLKAQTLPMTKERKAFYEAWEANQNKRERAGGDPVRWSNAPYFQEFPSLKKQPLPSMPKMMSPKFAIVFTSCWLPLTSRLTWWSPAKSSGSFATTFRPKKPNFTITWLHTCLRTYYIVISTITSFGSGQTILKIAETE